MEKAVTWTKDYETKARGKRCFSARSASGATHARNNQVFSPQALWDETARYGGQRGPRLLRRFSTNKNHTGVSGDYYFVTKLRMNLFFGKKVHRLTVEEPSKGGRTLNKDIAFMNA